ncbi:MAG TPA: Uma2 family endonuclease [Firmicutes bacterium]|nr:Uma2 family endonuclease [Bacillota bacterium]
MGEAVVPYGSPGGRLTYEDYCRMPSGNRYELLEGDIRMTPSPSVTHQEISKRLEIQLVNWIEGRGLGKVFHAPIDVILSHRNVVQPDVLYVCKERLGIIREANIKGAPDLVVEILSPSDEDWDRVTKRQVYARYGVREYWLVDPVGKSVEVAHWQDGELVTVQVYGEGATLTSSILPGLTIDVGPLFRPWQEG